MSTTLCLGKLIPKKAKEAHRNRIAHPLGQACQVEIRLERHILQSQASHVTILLCLGRGPRRDKAHAQPLSHGLEDGLVAAQAQGHLVLGQAQSGVGLVVCVALGFALCEKYE